MKKNILLLTVIVLMTGLLKAESLLLAKDRVAFYTIVTGENAIPSEIFAAEELSNILQKISSAKFQIISENNLDNVSAKRIYVGWTQFAEKQGYNLSAFSTDEWLISTQDDQLLICGGRPRGTLYAAYEFLAELGYKYFDYYNEIIPQKKELVSKRINKKGKPYFQERHIYTQLPENARDQRFRAVMKDTRPKEAKFGFGYGLGTHTFWRYAKNFPPDKPEYLALNAKGERPVSTSGHGPGQICLTNPGAREHVLQQVLQEIKEDYEKNALAKDGREIKKIYAINQNDIHFICQCPDCQTLSDKEAADSAAIVDFINYIADGVKEKYPDIILESWAYSNTIKAPASIKSRDNVLVRVIQLNGEWSIDAIGKKNWSPNWYPDLFRPRTHPVNAEALNILQKWGDISSYLGIWGYWLLYRTKFPTPYSNIRNIYEELKLYKKYNAISIFIENEGAETTSFFSLKNWLGWKLMEDPDQDLDSLLDEFFQSYYGNAAEIMLQYFNFMEDSIAAVPAEAGNLSSLAEERRQYLNPDFFLKSNQLLSDAEMLCGSDRTRLLNVRRERIPLDAALYAMWGLLNNQLPADKQLPWEAENVLARYEEYRLEQIKERAAPGNEETLQKHLQKLTETHQRNLTKYIMPPAILKKENLLKNNISSAEKAEGWQKLSAAEQFLDAQLDTETFPNGANFSLRFNGEEGKKTAYTQKINNFADIKNFHFGGWMKTKDFENAWQVSLQIQVRIKDSEGQIKQKSFTAGNTSYQTGNIGWSYYGVDFEIEEEIISMTARITSAHPSGTKVEQERANKGTAWLANAYLQEK